MRTSVNIFFELNGFLDSLLRPMSVDFNKSKKAYERETKMSFGEDIRTTFAAAGGRKDD